MNSFGFTKALQTCHKNKYLRQLIFKKYVRNHYKARGLFETLKITKIQLPKLDHHGRTLQGNEAKKRKPKERVHDPLEWQKKNEHTYSVLAKLAKLFLCIPVSSAPSEHIWSRAALVLSLKRANMNEELASGIMFVKENLKLLKQYYAEVTKDFENALPLQFTGLPDCFNIKAEDEIDVGQDLF